MNNNLSDFFNSLPEKDKFKEHIPLNRCVKTNVISVVVSILASERATYITCQNIRVDGGITKSV